MKRLLFRTGFVSLNDAKKNGLLPVKSVAIQPESGIYKTASNKSGIVCCICAVFILLGGHLSAQNGVKIQQVLFQEKEGKLLVVVTGTGALPYTTLSLSSPERLVIDFKNSVFPYPYKEININKSPLSLVKVNQFDKATARVVIVFTAKSQYNLDPSPDRKTLTFSVTKGSVLEKKVSVMDVAVKKIQGAVQVTVSGSGALRYKLREMSEPPRFLLQIPKAGLTWKGQEVLVEEGKVEKVFAKELEDSVEVSIELTAMTEYDVSLSKDSKKIVLLVGKKQEVKKEEVKKEEVVKKEEKKKEEIKPVEKTAQINNVVVREKDGKVQVAFVTAGAEKLKFSEKKLAFPSRVEITVDGAAWKLPKETVAVNKGKVKQVRGRDTSPGTVKVVVDLLDDIPYEVTLSEDGKELVFESASGTEKAVVKEEKKPEEKKEETKPEEKKPEEKKEEKITEIQLVAGTVEITVLGSKMKIKVSGKDKISGKVEELKFPARLKLAITGELEGPVPSTIEVNQGPLKSIKAASVGGGNDFTLQLVRMVSYNSSLSEGKSVMLELDVPEDLAVKAPSKVTPQKVTMAPVISSTAKSSVISSVSAGKEANQIKVAFQGTQPLRYKITSLSKPDRISIDFYNASFSTQPVIPINRGAVKQARFSVVQKQPQLVTRVVLDLKQKVKYSDSLSTDGKILSIYTEIPPNILTVVAKVTPKKVTKPTKVSKIPTLPEIPLPPKTYLPGLKSVPVSLELKDANVIDAIRLLGEVSGLNVFILPEVSTAVFGGGTTGTLGIPALTFSFRNLDVLSVLDWITRGSNLLYRIVGNTIVVGSTQATLDKIGGGLLFGDYVVQTFPLYGYNRTEFTKVLAKAVPEATVIDTPDRPNDTITLVGPQSSLDRVKLIIGTTPLPPNIEVETFDTGDLAPSEVESALKKAVPEATVIPSTGSINLITISGTSYTLDRVRTFMGRMKVKSTISFQTFEIRQNKTEEVRKVLEQLLPGIRVVKELTGTDSSSLTLSGTSAQLTQAKSIVDNMEGGTSKTIAKNIEILQLKNFETLAALQETSGQDIVTLLTLAVPGVTSNDIKKDDRNNTIIVKATPSDMEKIKSALAKIDVKLPQVLITAQVIDLTSSAAKNFSANWSMTALEAGSDVTPSVDITTSGTSAGNIGVNVSFLKADFNVGLSALITKGLARVLAAPKVSSVSGKEASINLTDNVPVLTQTQTTTTAGAVVTTTTTTVTSVGINLKMTPRVNEDKTITLSVDVDVTTISGEFATGNVPPTKSRKVKTLLRLKDGQNIVIGGLINQTERETLQKIPIIGELPILGTLFSSKNRTSSDSEVQIIISAKIQDY